MDARAPSWTASGTRAAEREKTVPLPVRPARHPPRGGRPRARRRPRHPRPRGRGRAASSATRCAALEHACVDPATGRATSPPRSAASPPACATRSPPSRRRGRSSPAGRSRSDHGRRRPRRGRPGPHRPGVGAVAGLRPHAALDAEAAGHRPARRCGVIRTEAVTGRTTLLLVRYRFHLTLPGPAAADGSSSPRTPGSRLPGAPATNAGLAPRRQALDLLDRRGRGEHDDASRNARAPHPRPNWPRYTTTSTAYGDGARRRAARRPTAGSGAHPTRSCRA